MSTPEEKPSTNAAAEPYLQPPAVILNPGGQYRAATRAFQGIPSIACVGQNRLYAVWYGGITPGEDHNNYVILTVSEDRGQSWSEEKLVINPDGGGPVRAFDPEIWLAPDGRLWLFWAQGLENKLHIRSGVWAMVAEQPDSLQPRWSAPRRLCDGVMMCKPLVLADGHWLLPVSAWQRRERASAAVWASVDRGETWAERGACDVPPEVRSHDEHMLVERRDGALWMLVRTNYGIGESISADGGRTWSRLRPTGIPHPSSRFFIRRLASGRLLMVRHDPAADEVATGQAAPTRARLTACLSDDDGRTWPQRLLLDERVGVSYPDGDQGPDGAIYVIYDYRRTAEREILMAAFGEADIINGATSARFRILVNRAGG